MSRSASSGPAGWGLNAPHSHPLHESRRPAPKHPDIDIKATVANEANKKRDIQGAPRHKDLIIVWFPIEYRPLGAIQSENPLRSLNFTLNFAWIDSMTCQQIRQFLKATVFRRRGTTGRATLLIQHTSPGPQSVGSSVCFVLLCLGLCSLGCGDANRSQLLGRWDLSALGDEALDQTGEPGENVIRDAMEDNQDFQDQISDGDRSVKMSIVFHGNGKLETMTFFSKGPSTKTGKWTWLKYDEATHTGWIQCTLSDQRFQNDEKVETKIAFLGNDQIRLVPPNIATLEQEMLFHRSQSQSSVTKANLP